MERHAALLISAILLGAFLLSGCAAPAKPAAGSPSDPADPSKPNPTRVSQNSGGPTSTEPGSKEPPVEYAQLETFRITLAAHPAAEGTTHTTKIGGNWSHVRVRSTIYANPTNPVNSGWNFLGDDPPGMIARWDDSKKAFASHSRSGIYYSFGPTGYYQYSTASSTADIPLVPASATFSTQGWGDLYVQITIERPLPPKNQTQESSL